MAVGYIIYILLLLTCALELCCSGLFCHGHSHYIFSNLRQVIVYSDFSLTQAYLKY